MPLAAFPSLFTCHNPTTGNDDPQDASCTRITCSPNRNPLIVGFFSQRRPPPKIGDQRAIFASSLGGASDRPVRIVLASQREREERKSRSTTECNPGPSEAADRCTDEAVPDRAQQRELHRTYTRAPGTLPISATAKLPPSFYVLQSTAHGPQYRSQRPQHLARHDSHTTALGAFDNDVLKPPPLPIPSDIISSLTRIAAP
ncbi:hypothetical protein LZ30DRAFT_205081 [Colletotrichum cereale]|nr:hypothetical protein LZ30DRAFT_205081 [Colletotrichum cereale]